MYNVGKLPEDELLLHRTVARSDVKCLGAMLKDIADMGTYINDSNLMSAEFTEQLRESEYRIRALRELFARLEAAINIRLEDEAANAN